MFRCLFNQVIQSIPNAIGALCLNESGQAQLKKRLRIVPAIFSIFTSEPTSQSLDRQRKCSHHWNSCWRANPAPSFFENSSVWFSASYAQPHRRSRCFLCTTSWYRTLVSLDAHFGSFSFWWWRRDARRNVWQCGISVKPSSYLNIGGIRRRGRRRKQTTR